MKMFISTCPECGRRINRAEPVRSPEVMQHCPYCGADAFMKVKRSYISSKKKVVSFQLDGMQCYDLYQKELRRSAFAPQAIRSRFIPEPVAVYLPPEEAGFSPDPEKTPAQGRQPAKEVRQEAKENQTKEGSPAEQTTHEAKEEQATEKPLVAESGREAKEKQTGRKTPAEQADGGGESVKGAKSVSGKSSGEGVTSEDYLPVWIITGRYNNRVYQTRINGQTGRVHANLPMSPVKYLLLCAALTVVLTLLFTWIPMPAASVILVLYALAAIIVLFLSLRLSQRFAEHLDRQSDGASRLNSSKSAGARKSRTDHLKKSAAGKSRTDLEKGDAVGRFLLRAGKTGLETTIALIILMGAELALQPVIGYASARLLFVIGLIIYVFKRRLKPLLFLLAVGAAYVFHVALDDGYETFAGLVILLFSLLELRSFYHGLKLADQFPKGKKRYARDAVPAAAAAVLSSFTLAFTNPTLLSPVSPVHILTLAGTLASLILMMAHYNRTVTDPLPGSSGLSADGIEGNRRPVGFSASGSAMPGFAGVNHVVADAGMDAQIGEAFTAHFRDADKGLANGIHTWKRLAGQPVSKKMTVVIAGIAAVIAVAIVAAVIVAAVTGNPGNFPFFSPTHTSVSQDGSLTTAVSPVLLWIVRTAGAVELSMLAAYAGLMYSVKRR